MRTDYTVPPGFTRRFGAYSNTSKAARGGPQRVGGAMGEVVRNAFRLTDADRHAIAVYLKSVPPIRSKKESG